VIPFWAITSDGQGTPSRWQRTSSAKPNAIAQRFWADRERERVCGTCCEASALPWSTWRGRLWKLDGIAPLCNIVDFLTLIDLVNQLRGVVDQPHCRLPWHPGAPQSIHICDPQAMKTKTGSIPVRATIYYQALTEECRRSAGDQRLRYLSKKSHFGDCSGPNKVVQGCSSPFFSCFNHPPRPPLLSR